MINSSAINRKSAVAVMMAVVVCMAGFAVLADDADAAETTYTVTFYVDGTEYATVASDASGAVALPAEPSKSGYTFLGWSATNGAEAADSGLAAGATTYNVTGDTTLYAVFEVEEYTVTFTVEGAAVSTVDGITNGSTIDTTSLIVPSKEHYTFLGWADADGNVLVTYNYLSGAYVDGTWSISADTVLYACFQADTFSVTYMAGDDVVAAIAVEYGGTAVSVTLPDGYSAWDFDFSTVITENTVIYAVEADPVESYTVSFVVDGTTIATYDSQNVTLPSSPSKDGYEFAGWAVGTEIISDPVAYACAASADVAFTATFSAVSIEYCTVTFDDNGTVSTVTVVKGAVIDSVPAASEGYQWDPAVDLASAVEEDMTVSAVPEYCTVTFYVGQTRVAALTATVAYGAVYDTSNLEGYTMPDGYTGWDFDFETAITADTAICAVEKEKEPAFWETSTGQIVIFLVILAILAIIYAYWNNCFGLKDLLSRSKDKDEKE